MLQVPSALQIMEVLGTHLAVILPLHVGDVRTGGAEQVLALFLRWSFYLFDI